MDRLQSVLNAAARQIFSAWKSERISPLLRELHWLRVPQRIRFRLCVLAFRCFHGRAPSYLADSLRRAADFHGRRHPRSANTESLVVPSTPRSTCTGRPRLSGGCGQSVERSTANHRCFNVADYIPMQAQDFPISS